VICERAYNLVEGLVNSEQADEHHEEDTNNRALSISDLLLSCSTNASSIKSSQGEVSNSNKNQTNNGGKEHILGSCGKGLEVCDHIDSVLWNV
jgi:hypothetical protein